MPVPMVDHRPEELGVKIDGLGDAPHREVPRDPPPVGRIRRFHAGAAEGERRMGVDVQEVRRAHVPVALLITRVDARRLDLQRDGGIGDGLGDVDDPREAGEAAPDLGHHQVAHGRLDQGMGGVEVIAPHVGHLVSIDRARQLRLPCCHGHPPRCCRRLSG